MRADGSGQTNLTKSPGNDHGPAWSPNGAHIAFASERNGNIEIYKMGAGGENQTRLTNTPGFDSYNVDPVWSPDGGYIAFASERYEQDHSFDWEVYKMRADGSGQTRLTYNTQDDIDPAFSPDGRQIAFTSYRDDNYEIYKMRADGSGQTNLTKRPASDLVGDWQPKP